MKLVILFAILAALLWLWRRRTPQGEPWTEPPYKLEPDPYFVSLYERRGR